MPKLIVFNSVTLDGYSAGENGDISWAHQGSDDPEWNAFMAGTAKGGARPLFGRITYDLILSCWPSPAAMMNAPVVSRGVDRLTKEEE